MAQTYCGNNLNFSGIANGTHILGTNYQCLQKGIGVGLHLPYDELYTLPYAPVDARTFYCGNNPILPVGGGYFAAGSPSKCLQKGIGIGKRQRSLLGRTMLEKFVTYILPYLLFFFGLFVVLGILYVMKPKFLSDHDKINQKKFMIFGGICVTVGIIFLLLQKLY